MFTGGRNIEEAAQAAKAAKAAETVSDLNKGPRILNISVCQYEILISFLHDDQTF